MNWPSDAVQPGTRVCLKHNPARIGIVSNELDGSSVRLRGLVMFNDGTVEFVLLSSLEPIVQEPQKPYTMIKEGRYGRAQDLRAAITFHRLSGRLANLIYSMNTTNTQFMAHQFKPVLNFLDSPTGGILIADEVGLGKTIEAGLIWTELKARYEAKRLLVICPAMLRDKWQMELNNRFGVKADIVDAGELCKHLKKALQHPYEEFALIASIQGLRPPKDAGQSKRGAAQLAQFLQDAVLEDHLLDLTIIDEAHYLRNEETQTNKLGALLRPITDNLVLLSATPIQMRNRDLFNLLHLLDDDAFPFENTFDDTLHANEPLLRLRNLVLSGVAEVDTFRDNINQAKSHHLFDNNKQLQFLFEHPPIGQQLKDRKFCAELAEQLDRINPLAKVINRTLKREVTEMNVIREPMVRIASMSIAERKFYECITIAIREYCEMNDVPVGFMLTIPQRQLSSCMAAACRRWLRKGGLTEAELDTTAEELLGGMLPEKNAASEQPGPLISELIELARINGHYPTLKKEDSKYTLLLNDLVSYWNNHPNTKVILFAFYTDTLHYLDERLREDGIIPLVLHGGMDKSEIIQRFEIDNSINILLTSEVAAEGVDLQFSAVVINYDLPWNPMRIEQRIGRIDRIGQKAPKILIWNYLYENTIDERIYSRLLQRLDLFTRALGMMEGILGKEIRDMTIDLLTQRLTDEQVEERIGQTLQAIENNTRQQADLEKEAAQLIAHGDYILDKVRAAKELGRYIGGNDLLVYLKDFLHVKYPNSRVQLIDDKQPLYKCNLETEAQAAFAEFLERMHLKGKTLLLSHNPLPLEFENQLGGKQQGVERVNQEHPLIRFVTDCRKSTDSATQTYPVSAVVLSRDALPKIDAGDYLFTISRWSLTGAQVNERLVYLAHKIGGYPLDDDLSELLVNTAGVQGKDLLGAATLLNNEQAAGLFEDCQQTLENSFSKYQTAMERENHDRLQLMINLLIKRKERQGQAIRERINKHSFSDSPAKNKLVPMEKGKLRKLEEQIDLRINTLKLRETMTVDQNFVAGGIIRIY